MRLYRLASEIMPVPEATTLIWLAPIGGVIINIQERYPSPFGNEGQLDPIPLEDGVSWHLSPTDRHRSLLRDYYEFYGDFYAKSEVEIHVDADTILEGEPFLADTATQPFVVSFVLAASLHLNCRLSTQMLRFEVTDQTRPHSGYPKIEATRLNQWPEQEVITQDKARAISETYRAVRRSFNQDEEHASRRAAAAYRAAAGSTFVDTIPVLLCASLEAVAGRYKEREVIPRVISHVKSLADDESRQRLRRLYKLRHWFAHSAAIPEMQVRSNREATLEEGYSLTKEIVRHALVSSDG